MHSAFRLVLLASAIGLTAVATAAAAPSVQIQNVHGRSVTDLGGAWHVIVDPYDDGYDERFGARYYQVRTARDPSDLVEYDFSRSPVLQVPGDWNTQRESLFLYEGSVWYQRTLDAPVSTDRRQFLYFGAANYRARVYLNGEEIGRHEGGFTPFCFEVTGKLKPAGNQLVVAVENRRRREGVPTLSTDWFNYGGLTREVLLVETPRVFVRDYFVQLAKGARDRIAGWVQVDGATGPERVTIRIPEAKLESTVTTDASGRAEVSFAAPGLELWSPERPKLYDVEISTASGSIRDAIGFRTIETRGTDILLNGQPVFLRGVCIHEESPVRAGRMWSAEDAATTLGWAKELGCNYVRLAHYPHNENMIREADRLGLLVWSEVPVYWSIAWEEPTTLALARQQIEENIARDHNRACIALWSIANETPSGDARLRFLTNLAARVRELDATRLVTAAIFSTRVSPTAQTLEDPLGEQLDVLGCNEYIGWYERTPEDADPITWTSKYDKPLIMSEFGAEGVYGMHGDPAARFTEDYQVRFYEHQLRMLDKIPFLRGTTPWVLKDFRSPRRQLPGVQDGFNRKGLVSDRGQRKAAFYVMQHWYREKVNGGER
jgi:beta-glucuronidase